MRIRDLAIRSGYAAIIAVFTLGGVACSSPPEEITVSDTDIEAMAAERQVALMTASLGPIYDMNYDILDRTPRNGAARRRRA